MSFNFFFNSENWSLMKSYQREVLEGLPLINKEVLLHWFNGFLATPWKRNWYLVPPYVTYSVQQAILIKADFQELATK